MRALAFAHNSQAECVHDVAHVKAVALYPVHDYRLDYRTREIGLFVKDARQRAHELGGLVAPALFDVFGVVSLGGFEEESGLFPKVGHEVDASFDEACGAADVFVGEVIGIHAVGAEHRLEELAEFGVGHHLEVCVVKPLALVKGKAGAGARAVGEREFCDEFVHTHHLRVVAGIPPEEGEEVNDGLGQIAAFAVAARHVAALGIVPFEGEYGESEAVAVALAELALAVGLEKKGKMHEFGRRVGPPEGFVEQHVKRSRRQPFFAADYVRHLHQMVVDDIRQMIRGQVIGALVEHLVVENVAFDCHLSAKEVVDLDVAARLDAEAHHVLLAGVDKALYFVGRERERVAHRRAGRCVVLEVGDFRALGFQLRGSVEGDVGLAGVKQLLDVLAVDVAALALLVRAIRASLAHAFVDFDSEPCEGFIDIILGSGNEALRIGVLDSENHFAAVLARKKIVIESGAYAADMERPCGGGRKSNSYFAVHVLVNIVDRDSVVYNRRKVTKNPRYGQIYGIKEAAGADPAADLACSDILRKQENFRNFAVL